MRRTSWALLLAATIAVTIGCSHKEQTTTSSGESTSPATSTSTEAAATVAPAPSGKLYVTFQFSDISVTSSGAPVLRLGFTIKNAGADPVLCTESAFSLELADGTVLDPDQGAENRCDPDTVDGGSSGKGTVFFDLKNPYGGTVKLIMRDSNNVIVGEGSAQIH
jgi:hypothetical protein